jgi:[acyl-carrier-protein] S-malonyltransferase
MKAAVLYAGQGSQKVGMGKDFYAQVPDFRRVLDQAASAVNFDLLETMFVGPEDVLGETSHTQPALAAFAAGVTEILRKRDIVPAYTAGLSLGEYSALYASGVLDLDTLMKVTAFRGDAMRRAGENCDTLMVALMGAGADKAEEICRKARENAREAGEPYRVSVSNYNSPEQNVISGDRAAVNRAVEIAKSEGIRRCLPLRVSTAFHTPIMDPAAAELKAYVASMVLRPMRIPVIFNVTGKPLPEAGQSGEADAIRKMMAQQIVTGVRMAQTIRYLADHGVDTVIEVGPGKAISGFVKKTAPEVRTITIDTVGDLEKLDDLI